MIDSNPDTTDDVAGAESFNAEHYLVGRRVEAGDGERVAVRGSRTLSYAHLAEHSAGVTAAFRGLGLRRDDRVVFVMADDVELFSAILGTFRAGMVAVPVSTMLGADELRTILADSGASVVVATHQFAEAVAGAVDGAPEVRTLVVHGDAEISTREGVTRSSWADFLAGGDGQDSGAAPTVDDAWALWLYTSGTTGSPKAAMHRHANIRHVCETYGDQVLGITPEDVCFSVAKLFFAYGIGNSMFFPLSVGASTVLEPQRPTPDVVADRVVAEAPTLFFGVPTFYAALINSSLPDDTFRSVRLGASAGEALPAPLLAKFAQRFGVDIIDGIGATEALHIFLSNRPTDIQPGTTGVPVPGYQVELRNADGELVGDGEPGDLYVRGESNAVGYWRRTAASRAVFIGEWLRTGDTYIRSAEGYFTCLGRSNDLLKAGGIWVSPAEVEARLLEHAAVAEAAVVGLPDEAGLDKPVACVVLSAEVTEDDLIAWCREGLASFKRPRAVLVVDELPKTATGKMQRFKVRELAAGLGTQARP